MGERQCGIRPNPLPEDHRREKISLFPGIDLTYWEIPGAFPEEWAGGAHTIQIRYCRSGQLAWKTPGGTCVSLDPGDFSVETVKEGGEVPTFPTGQCTGLTVCINLGQTAAGPPELLRGMDFWRLEEKLCRENSAAVIAGNGQTGSIFSGFYVQPEHLRLRYQKLKTLELLLYLFGLEVSPSRQTAEGQSGQLAIVREIHDRMTRQMGERFTIEELSREYLINPTTLKAAFKSVYGTSIAAHIKRHRMEQAAKLLRETDMRIAEIAQAVGYDSQSKFTAAFKAFYRVLPREYRKKT